MYIMYIYFCNFFLLRLKTIDIMLNLRLAITLVFSVQLYTSQAVLDIFPEFVQFEKEIRNEISGLKNQVSVISDLRNQVSELKRRKCTTRCVLDIHKKSCSITMAFIRAIRVSIGSPRVSSAQSSVPLC